ncbi:MAG: hypothetical protein LAP38_00510 [Acidobacteriia bacterium]|nr:hypothetical protein [Terriglobia bacterium]
MNTDAIENAIGALVNADEPAGAATLIWRDGTVVQNACVGWRDVEARLPGAFGGWWRADPSDNSVLVFLAHNIVELEQFAQGIGIGVFGAITQFQALASRTAGTSSRTTGTGD